MLNCQTFQDFCKSVNCTISEELIEKFDDLDRTKDEYYFISIFDSLRKYRIPSMFLIWNLLRYPLSHNLLQVENLEEQKKTFEGCLPVIEKMPFLKANEMKILSHLNGFINFKTKGSSLTGRSINNNNGCTIVETNVIDLNEDLYMQLLSRKERRSPIIIVTYYG
jgi:hypothetical protein